MYALNIYLTVEMLLKLKIESVPLSIAYFFIEEFFEASYQRFHLRAKSLDGYFCY